MSEPARITIAEAQARLMRKEAIVFVDARNVEAWDQAAKKLPHAVRVPLDDVDHFLGKIPRGETIVVYCTCPDEATSARVARILIEHGFDNVYPLAGGFKAWRDADYPLEQK